MALGINVKELSLICAGKQKVARIPRESVLSVKSSPISELIPPHPYGRGAQLSLALALSVELSVDYLGLFVNGFILGFTVCVARRLRGFRI